MRRLLASIMVALVWISAPAATAEEFCDDIGAILSTAPTEFVSLTGEPIPSSPSPDLAIFIGAQPLSGAGTCVVAQQTSNGRRFSTSYTCAGASADSDEGVQALIGQLVRCLNVTAWAEQQQADRRGAWLSQFGLIRLSITRNHASGLALGVEVFRDERGAVMGSPTRGDQVGEDGARRCRSRARGEIANSIAAYAAQGGAERFVTEEFLGYRNASTGVVAFVTRPIHPAHPALIVRRVLERDGAVSITAEGDFAGDCQAFHDLLRQTIELNQSLRPK